jgi:hypothetical protein
MSMEDSTQNPRGAAAPSWAAEEEGQTGAMGHQFWRKVIPQNTVDLTFNWEENYNYFNFAVKLGLEKYRY